MKRRRLSLAVVLLTAASAVYAWLTPFDSPDIYGGLPRVESFWLRLSTHTLQNPGFVVGYSEWRRAPLWVAFRASKIEGERGGARPDHFNQDERTLFEVESDDYRRSGYDRGHLAPNYLISRLYGREAQRATFLMSNIAPQTKRLNQLLWQRIEEAEADVVAPRLGELWVVTGPVYGEGKRLPSGVEVPEAFFRIWLDVQTHSALAFLTPQEVCGDEPLTDYLTTVDEVERRTGLDFFSGIEDTEEAALEAASANAHWQVESFSNEPARYAENFRGRRCTKKIPQDR
ncbi:MAG: DNA/RNA non-specific endonuclease [Pseudomonadota bacterium]